LPQHLVAQQAKGALCPFDVAVGNPDPVGVGQQSLVANPARLVLESERVLVHPGYFFDFPHEAFVVVSLLVEPAPFADAFERCLTFVNQG